MSYCLEQKKYPVKYDMRTILGFFALALVLYFAYELLGRTSLAGNGVNVLTAWPLMAIGTVLIGIYCAATWKFIIKRARS